MPVAMNKPGPASQKQLFLRLLSLLLLGMLAACTSTETFPPPAFDPFVFRKLAVVLDRGAMGSWDAAGVSSPTVLYDQLNFKFHMWYSGLDSTRWRIGYAYSGDGLTWFRHGTPVLEPGEAGSWDSESVLAPCVIQDGDTLRMWYTGQGPSGRHIGYAYSLDGLHWVKSRSNPILASEGSAQEPAVLKKENGEWFMLFEALGPKSEIRAARSSDGVHWTLARRTAVLSGSEGWDGGGVGAPTFISITNGLLLYYSGRGADGTWQIGEALSNDGLSWVRGTSEPALPVGAPVAWDGGSVTSASVLRSPDDTAVLLFYSGIDGGWWRIGLARKRL